MRKRTSSGFTIIELTLAMSFVSMLLISVAMLSIQLTNQYTRGLTLKEITQAGTEVTNDIKRTMGQVQLQGEGVRLRNVSGGAQVLCTGAYSYIRNTPDSLQANGGTGDANTVRVGPPGNATTPARFAKVRDLGGVLCSTNILDTNKAFETSDVSELLSGGSRLLSVRQLAVTPNGRPSAAHPFYQEFEQGRGYYEIDITIGAGLTSEAEIDGNSCKPPNDSTGQSNFEFCAINTFSFTSRVGSSNRQ